MGITVASAAILKLWRVLQSILAVMFVMIVVKEFVGSMSGKFLT